MCSKTFNADFVLDALEQALSARQPERDGSLIHPSDCGAQDVSIRDRERRAEAGIEPSVGSQGDRDDNALAETLNGLYKAERIRRCAPWKTREAAELAILEEWMSWFNRQRLLECIGYIPPAEAEANSYRQLAEKPETAVLTETNQPPRKPGRFKSLTLTFGKLSLEIFFRLAVRGQ